MKRKAKIFLIYFPVILVTLQVIVNLLSFIVQVPNGVWFYVNTFMGTNILFSLFLVLFTYLFHFCFVSRFAAIAELMFGVFFFFWGKDDIYNVLFQISVGVIAIVITFWQYIKRFPLCRMSLLFGFWASVVKKGSCKKGAEEWERNVKSIVLRKHHFK